MDATIKLYKRLEAWIQKGDVDGLLARWRCGRELLVERGDARRLTNGRVEELHRDCNTHVTVTGYRMELSRRMRFAEQYQTEAKVRAAFRELGSWSAICARGLLGRAVVEALVGTPDVDVKPPKWHPSSQFERQYYETLAHIRRLLRSHAIEYQSLWLSALARGIEQEIQALERQARHAAEKRPAGNLLTRT